ncbi:MAG: enoyl-CoA hydratase/isomerase family protein [Planctomycetes bacterium]|nr:enoyl-CoA hydratase/isomerase family protein [Planctomycetota bacterium]
MKAPENLQVERKDGVLVVRVHRPQVLNALSAATLAELYTVFKTFADDDRCGAALLTGGETGKKPAFAAGADIAEMSKLGGMELREHSRLGQAALAAIEDARKPVIAAIDGFALGGGLELAMACHIRHASEDARMGQPEINLGIIPGFGGTQRLPRLVGTGLALELLLTGDMIDAERALEIGLVDRVMPAAELFEQSYELASKLAAKAPLARSLILDAVLRGRGLSVTEACALEADHFGLVGATEDVREGLTAFLEKRPARFQGK